jgi:hypothetical protein
MIGVLSETEVLFVGRTQEKRVLRSLRVPPEIGEPGELLEFFWQTTFSSVWVMPATTLSRLATHAWFEQATPNWVVIPHAAPHEPTRPSCVVFWPRGGSQWRQARRLTLVFPEHAGWNWTLPDARSLLATVTYLEQVLTRSLIDAPEIVARQLLTELACDQPPAFLPVPQEKERLVSKPGAPALLMREHTRNLAWMRPLTLVEQRQRYLHKYTHLSWSLEACLSVQLGAGAPAYAANGRAYDGIRPGIWRVQAERGGSLFDGKRLPSGLESEWMSTPQVKCCQDLGYRIDVREGSFWSQAQAFLNPWAKTLWQAAECFHTHPQHYRHPQGRENTLRTITQLAHLGLTIITTEEQPDGWKRPDWGDQIVGRGRALLFAHLAALARKGTMPVLLDHDAIWVVSDNPNPLTAIPGLLTARTWNGYRAGYEVPLSLSREVQAAFRTTHDPDRLAMALDTLAGEDFL